MHVTNFSKCTCIVRYFALMAIRMVMNLQLIFFAETRFLQSLIMSGVQSTFLYRHASFLSVDLRLSEHKTLGIRLCQRGEGFMNCLTLQQA